MKKLLLILTIGFLALQSCKKDDSTASSASLNGRWDLTETKIEVFENGVSKQKSTETSTKGESYIVFAATTFEIFSDNVSEGSGTYTFNNSTKTLILKEGTDVETIVFKSYDGKTFVIANEETETNNGATIKLVYEIKFTKE
jgi:hypothetical protein